MCVFWSRVCLDRSAARRGAPPPPPGWDGGDGGAGDVDGQHHDRAVQV